MKKHPFKLVVASLFLEKPKLAAADVYKALLPEYPHSKLCTLPFIEQSLQSLSAVGILHHEENAAQNAAESSPNSSKESVHFALTAHGRRKVLWAVG